MNSFDLTEENFLNLLNEAKLTKLDFMNLIEHSNNINILSSWIKKGRFPYYVKLILDTAIKVKKYKECEQQAIKSDTLTFNEEDI